MGLRREGKGGRVRARGEEWSLRTGESREMEMEVAVTVVVGGTVSWGFVMCGACKVSDGKWGAFKEVSGYLGRYHGEIGI